MSPDQIPPESPTAQSARSAELEAPSIPAGPLAIEHLAMAVDGMRKELRESFQRLEANYGLIMGELQALMRARADHETRITELEIRVRRKSAAKIVKRSKKRARK